MIEPLIIRASSTTGHPDCPRRWAAGHMRGEVEAAGYQLRTCGHHVGAAIGSGLHAAVAALHQSTINGGSEMPATIAVDLGIGEMERRIAEAETIWDGKAAPNLDSAQKQIGRMYRCYAAEIAPSVNAVEIELRLEAQVDPKGLFVLSGQKDLTAREPNRLRDLKTFGAKLGWHGPQLGCYSLLDASREPGRARIPEAVIDAVARVPLSRPQPPARTVRYDLAECEADAVAVLRSIMQQVKAWRGGTEHSAPLNPRVFPANPSSILCSAKYCPAWGTAFCTAHKES